MLNSYFLLFNSLVNHDARKPLPALHPSPRCHSLPPLPCSSLSRNSYKMHLLRRRGVAYRRTAARCHCVMRQVHSAMYTFHFELHSVRRTSNLLHFAMYTLHFATCLLHFRSHFCHRVSHTPFPHLLLLRLAMLSIHFLSESTYFKTDRKE